MPCRIVPADAKGHFPTAAPATPPMGLSPHMQGAHLKPDDTKAADAIIPAYAGSAQHSRPWPNRQPDHLQRIKQSSSNHTHVQTMKWLWILRRHS